MIKRPFTSIILIISFAVIIYACKYNRTNIKLDITKPFQISLGRGSGWHGLDTIEINQSGIVTLHKMTKNGWQSGQLKIDNLSLNLILDKFHDLNLLQLNKKYAANVHDGTQWILWTQQSSINKSSYFDNKFPNSIKTFATFIDDILIKQNYNNIKWLTVPLDQARQHEKAIWASIRQN
jgi:hypothetical protein